MDEKIKKRISERTGLENKFEIEAYVNFVESADADDGLIMFGDCRHEFWKDIYQEIIVKTYGEQIYKSIDFLDKNKKLWIEEMVNPFVDEMATKSYNYYLNVFIQKGLVGEPKFFRKNTDTKYPVLKSYNFYNDPDFYIPYRKKGSDEWSGRVSKDFLTEKIRKEWEQGGEEFKF